MATLKSLSLFVIILLLATRALASYTLSDDSSVSLEFNKPTHIIISGKGNDLRLNPMIAALAKAKKISSTFTADQILVINVQEVSDSEHESTLKEFGFHVTRSEQNLLDVKRLMLELEKFKQIASLNFYGHSGIEPGSFLDGHGEDDLKWLPLDRIASRLLGHFTDRAYAVLNGCNQGQLQAPFLSKLWGIPVAGTFTSSHFEVRYKDGSYHWEDLSQHQMFVPHSQHGLRMKPDYILYEGVYGRYRAGLPFFKFFCSGLSRERCLRGMKASVYADLSVTSLPLNSSEREYQQVVREWLCPNYEFGSNAQQNCIHQLEKIDITTTIKTYTPFLGPSLQCDFESCFPVACYVSASAMSKCAQSATRAPPSASTSFVDEYLAYVEAFAIP